MTHYKALIDTDYLGQWDFPTRNGKQAEVTVIIDTVSRFKPKRTKKKKMPDGSWADEPIKRLEIGLRNARGPIRKKWLSGPATQQIIAGMYGNDIEGWSGKTITLYVDAEVMMGRAKVGGVRVKNVRPTESAGDDEMDREPEPEKVKELDNAFGREPGSNDE